jgi:hypothetical protein
MDFGGPCGCEMSRVPHFLDNRLTDGVEVVRLKCRPSCIRGSRLCHIAEERIMPVDKNPMPSSGITSPTIWFVAQFLNQVVSLKCRPPFVPRSRLGRIVDGRIMPIDKNPLPLIGNQIPDLLICSTVPQSGCQP